MSWNLELTPTLRFDFADRFVLDPRLMVSLVGRVRLAWAGGFHAAFTWAVPITVDLDERPVGWRFGLAHPGLVLDYTFPDAIALVLGARLEPDLVIQGTAVGFDGYLPFLFGLEGAVTPRIRMGGKLELGPAFGAGPGVRLRSRALLAVDVAW